MTTEHLRFLKKFRRRRRMVVFLRILILFLFLLQWEICADTGVVDSFIFSSPSRIITCFLKMTEDGSVFHHIGITLYETLVSFLLVTLTSILTAILLWLFFLWSAINPGQNRSGICFCFLIFFHIHQIHDRHDVILNIVIPFPETGIFIT